MQNRILILLMAVLSVSGYSVLPLSGLNGTAQAQGLFLGEKHKNIGIDCSGCHKENPPKQNAPMTVCLECHGDYSKVAAKTNKTNPNPHDSHLGEIDCEKCHHAHKASVNTCAACHLMEMKVP